MLEPVAIGRLELLQEPPFTLCGTRQQRSRASLRDLIFECRAFGVIFLEPYFRGVGVCEHLEMIGITDLLARVERSYRQILVTAGPVRRRRLRVDGRSAWR